MIHRLQVAAEEAGERLDRFLATRLTALSRNEVRARVDLGAVHIDGRRSRKCGQSLVAGQRLEFHVDDGPLEPYRISTADVLYQDRHLIALNKPAGVETQPTLARYRGTLYEALQLWLGRDTRFGRKLEIGMVQRLDRDTSGVILFSIHPRAHKGVSEQIQQRLAEKSYLAFLSGHLEPAEGEWRSRLARDRRQSRVVTVADGGREALSRFRLRRTYQGACLVELTLITGRTHQIRAQAAAAGHPLLGDRRYGGPQTLAAVELARHALHSRRLILHHPVSGERLAFVAPLPADLLALHRQLPPLP